MDTPAPTPVPPSPPADPWDQAVAGIEALRIELRDRLAMVDHQAGEIRALGGAAPESALIILGKAERACDELKKQLEQQVKQLKAGSAARFERWIRENEQALEKKIRARLEAAGLKPASVDGWLNERTAAADFSPLVLEVMQLNGAFPEWAEIRAGKGFYAAQP